MSKTSQYRMNTAIFLLASSAPAVAGQNTWLEVMFLKNIIIAGPSRAGKTTLARKINEELNYFVISLDKLTAVFCGAYPELNIRLNWNREKTTEHLAPFLGHFLGTFSSNRGEAYELNLRAHAVTGNRFVLEGAYFHFEKISSILKLYGIEELRDQFLLIGLVQNKKTAEEFFSDFRKYDTEDDWTYHLDDHDLRDVSQEAVSYSRSMTGYLMKYGFTVYDTSVHRERVLNQIIEDIQKTNCGPTPKGEQHGLSGKNETVLLGGAD